MLLVSQVVGLDCGDSDIQEANRRGKADEAHVEHGVEADQVREGNRVQELNLYERVLRVNIEVDVDEYVEQRDQTKDYKI